MFRHRRILLAAILCGAFLSLAGSANGKFIPGLDRVLTDDGEVYRAGCITGDAQIRSRACRFGFRNSNRKVVLLGDSHAAQWGPALFRVALAKDWRVIVLTRASCPAALVNIEDHCNIWRRNSLRRIRRIRPGLVIVASAANYDHYLVRQRGDMLSRNASEHHLVQGMVRTLRFVKRWSGETVLIRDHSSAPYSVTKCLERSRRQPFKCGFHSRRKMIRSYDFKASQMVKGVRVIDPQPLLCPDRWCRAVDGKYLIYRNPGHLAASFIRRQDDWLGSKLGDPWSENGPNQTGDADSSPGRNPWPGQPGHIKPGQ